MAFAREDIQANRRYFEDKLRSTKQLHDVIQKVEAGSGDFLLLDTRPREAFAQGHIRGAWCAPLAELASLAPGLPKDRELVTYCWKDT
ncbi:MAG: rhodanese-like domain-containing protein [Deferrisomatales bacterium]|nr:rhodanese-like domain-containing protein [Deferrisomatales bacterium]